MTRLPEPGRAYCILIQSELYNYYTVYFGLTKLLDDGSKPDAKRLSLPTGTWIQIISVQDDYRKFPEGSLINFYPQGKPSSRKLYLSNWIQADIRWGCQVFRHCWFSKHSWHKYFSEYSIENWEPTL